MLFYITFLFSLFTTSGTFHPLHCRQQAVLPVVRAQAPPLSTLPTRIRLEPSLKNRGGGLSHFLCDLLTPQSARPPWSSAD